MLSKVGRKKCWACTLYIINAKGKLSHYFWWDVDCNLNHFFLFCFLVYNIQHPAGLYCLYQKKQHKTCRYISSFSPSNACTICTPGIYTKNMCNCAFPTMMTLFPCLAHALSYSIYLPFKFLERVVLGFKHSQRANIGMNACCSKPGFVKGWLLALSIKKTGWNCNSKW